VLLGSQKGGIDVQTALEEMQHVVVDQEFSPFYARRLALKMGLQGTLIESVSTMLEKMYRLFVQNDLDLVEINPLGVTATGEVMALDGKITVNDDALARHPALSALIAKSDVSQAAHLGTAPVTMESDGQIGVLCNGAGLTMATMDAVSQAGGYPAVFLNLGGETQWDASPAGLCEQLERGLEQMVQTKQVRVLLINLVSGLIPCDDIATVITKYLLSRMRKPRSISEISPEALIAHATRFPQLVVRLVGRDRELARSRLETVQVSLIDSLNEAVTHAVTLAKTATRNS
jgi:succinyl-CoA synthetase beta subunit